MFQRALFERPHLRYKYYGSNKIPYCVFRALFSFRSFLSGSHLGYHIGDTCFEACSIAIINSYCNLTSNTCQCLESHPINIGGVACYRGKTDSYQLHIMVKCSLKYGSRCNHVNSYIVSADEISGSFLFPRHDFPVAVVNNVKI